MSEEIPSLLLESYEALSQGDLDAWLDAYTPEAEMHDPPEAPDAGVRRGHREARKWAETMLQTVEEWRWIPEDLLLNEGDTLLVRTRIVGQSRAGLPIDFEIFHLFHTDGDKLASVQGFLDLSSALEAAGSSD